MIRKTIFAVAAVATLGATALAPTSASAWGFKGWPHHYHGFGWGIGYVNVVPSCYFVQKVTPAGAVQFIEVCN